MESSFTLFTLWLRPYLFGSLERRRDDLHACRQQRIFLLCRNNILHSYIVMYIWHVNSCYQSKVTHFWFDINGKWNRKNTIAMTWAVAFELRFRKSDTDQRRETMDFWFKLHEHGLLVWSICFYVLLFKLSITKTNHCSIG